MLSPPPNRWTVRGLTFALWVLGAASAAYWALKVAGGPGAAAPAPLARGVPQIDPAAVARLLGSAPSAALPAAPTLASRFNLLGVIAGPGRDRGAALIAVDGKPARPFRVGTSIDEGLVLQSVEGRRAVLAAAGSGQPMLTLELPEPRSTGQPAMRPFLAGPPPGVPASPGQPAPGFNAPATLDPNIPGRSAPAPLTPNQPALSPNAAPR